MVAASAGRSAARVGSVRGAGWAGPRSRNWASVDSRKIRKRSRPIPASRKFSASQLYAEKKPRTNPISSMKKAAMLPMCINSSWSAARGNSCLSRASRPSAAFGLRTEPGRLGVGAPALGPLGPGAIPRSPCALPQKRQNRASASIGLPQLAQKVIGSPAGGPWVAKAAQL